MHIVCTGLFIFNCFKSIIIMPHYIVHNNVIRFFVNRREIQTYSVHVLEYCLNLTIKYTCSVHT